MHSCLRRDQTTTAQVGRQLGNPSSTRRALPAYSPWRRARSGLRKARRKTLAGPPRGASNMQQLVNENCSNWYKETEMICHAGDPYAGPQAALAKRKEHSRLRRAALSATASASWFFVDSVTPETPGSLRLARSRRVHSRRKGMPHSAGQKNTLSTQLHCNDRIQLTSSMDPSINAFLQATINPLSD